MFANKVKFPSTTTKNKQEKRFPTFAKNSEMLSIETFTFNPFQENTYIVYNDSGSCMVVDPGCYDRREADVLKSFIKENNLSPELLVNTHCHLDHVFGNHVIESAYGLSPYIHPKEQPIFDSVAQVASMYGLNYTPGGDPLYYTGDEIRFSGEIFQVLFTPGHAPGHVSLYHADSGMLLSGDVLFRESVGRTDLPGGNMATLMKSIREKLFTLPDDTRVYAGHMGPTTIGHEKKFNPFLKS
jgi:glyoxylase-like metal-dependent hydrolase (beta-lactamase superfamily II)